MIVKHSGDISNLSLIGIRVEQMVNEYSILTVPESLIDQLSALPQIEYVEKPKRLFFCHQPGKVGLLCQFGPAGKQSSYRKGSFGSHH